MKKANYLGLTWDDEWEFGDLDYGHCFVLRKEDPWDFAYVKINDSQALSNCLDPPTDGSAHEFSMSDPVVPVSEKIFWFLAGETRRELPSLIRDYLSQHRSIDPKELQTTLDALRYESKAFLKILAHCKETDGMVAIYSDRETNDWVVDVDGSRFRGEQLVELILSIPGDVLKEEMPGTRL